MKICFSCQIEKPFCDFYKHKQKADGHFGKCKECTKADVIANRAKNADYYREYDRKRGCRVDPEYTRRWRSENFNKYKAESAVSNAIRDGRLKRKDCEICGAKKSHAHHDDYLKPLDVRFLCPIHHKEWHMKNGEGINGQNQT